MTVEHLSQEWLDVTRELAASQPEHPGATARIQYVISGAPSGTVEYAWDLQDGRLLASFLGRIADPDITIRAGHADWVAIARGDLDLEGAFLQGRVTVDGPPGVFLRLLPLTRSAEYVALQREVRAVTDFG